ncbi:MAG: helix-turn-helix transcriptional regulator [Candidatus Krumholzibacteria bacterium]|nr:helix-turn-helix transcriptional regulator [Candidatus Krumholzibacteria bacterium]
MSDTATSGLESLLDEVLEPSSPLIEPVADGADDPLEKRYRLLMLKLEGNRKFMLEINERLGNLAREQNELNLSAVYDLIGEIGSLVLDNAREIKKMARASGIEPDQEATGPETPENAPVFDAKIPCVRMTDREKEILGELLLGKTNREISLSLGINEKTVKNHLWKIYRKWNVTSRTQIFLKIISR